MPKPRGGGNWGAGGAGGARGAGGAHAPRQKIIPLKTKPTGPILDEDFRISIEKELKEFNENHDAQGKIFFFEYITGLFLFEINVIFLQLNQNMTDFYAFCLLNCSKFLEFWMRTFGFRLKKN